MTRPDAPGDLPLRLELRVHGVGGPQAVKMLGELVEQDVVTVPSFVVPCAPGATGSTRVRLPKDVETRFAQRLTGDRTEAYEWGGLTAASLTKALWVLYLPFTLVNATGWAHAASRSGNEVRGCVRWHIWLAHIVSGLATLTYVAWISYLTLDLVARDWVEHVRRWDKPPPGTVTSNLVFVWTPWLAAVMCIALVGGLLWAPVVRGRFEEVRGADPGVDPEAPWPRVPSLIDAGFFAHERSYARRLTFHGLVGVAGLVAALAQYLAGWHGLGAVLLGLGTVQALVLAALAIVDIAGRNWRLPSEVFAKTLMTDPSLDDAGSRMPAGAVFATVGTALAHAAFAGLAMTLAPLLARWPKGDDGKRLTVGPELRAADVLVWVLVLLVVFTALLALRGPKAAPQTNAAGTAEQGVVARLARRAPRLGRAALVAVVIPVAVYFALNVSAVIEKARPTPTAVSECGGLGPVRCWYSTYDLDEDAFLRRAGSFVLVLLPAAVFGVLRGKYDTGLGRVVGNVWDVLTFWPRRFHPYAAPCSAERAVPELRARICHALERLGPEESSRFVVVAHSQGAVLSAAAIASIPPDARQPSLVTFGSPLGTLYTPTWPAYVPPLLACVSERVRDDHPATPWVNFWRITDPIGGETPAAYNIRLGEPQAHPLGDLQSIRQLRPLERPSRWGTVAGHGRYLAEPEVQDAIRDRRRPVRWL